MADPNLGQTVTHAWEAIVKSQPEDCIFENYWLFDQLKSGSGFKTIDGGRQIQQPIEYATNATVSSMSEMETISTSRTDLFDTATYEWKMYGGTVVQSELEDAINQGSGTCDDTCHPKKEGRAVVNMSLFGCAPRSHCKQQRGEGYSSSAHSVRAARGCRV
jgi:hypothetical protein